MMRLILLAIRLYLRGLALVSPKLAGRKAFEIFCTPRFRRKTPSQVEDVMARAERRSLEVDGISAQGYFWPLADDPDAERVLLVHGWESRAGRLAQWVEPLHEAGFAVAAFDAPAHGESEGKSTNPFHFALAMHALQGEVGPFSGIICHSMGCIGTGLAIGGGSFLDRDDLPVQKLVVIAGAESGQVAMADFCQVLGLGEKFPKLVWDAAADSVGRPMEDLAGHRLLVKHETPILWLHDPADDEVPISEAECVAQASPHVRLERLEGLGHHRIARDPSVIEKGIRFLVES